MPVADPGALGMSAPHLLATIYLIFMQFAVKNVQ